MAYFSAPIDTAEHWLVKLLFGEEPSKGVGEESWEF